MKGWLIVNNYLDGKKYQDIYHLLLDAAKNKNMALELKKTGDIFCSLDDDFLSYNLPDFVIFWDKDIFLAKRLEALNVPCFNCAQGIYLSDNKAETMRKLITCNIRVPKTFVAPKTFENINYSNLNFYDYVVERLDFPFVIKEAYGSFGKQVYLVDTYQKGLSIIEKMGYKEFIIQEFISSSYGKDTRVNVVGGRVHSAILRKNDHDFRSNISNGGKMYKTKLSLLQEEVAINACKALGLDFGGVDLLEGANQEVIVCEVNSNPHFKSTLECTNLNLGQAIIDYIWSKLCKVG